MEGYFDVGDPLIASGGPKPNLFFPSDILSEEFSNAF